MTAIFKAPYYKADGKKGRARPLPAPLFNGVVNEGVVHQAVKVYLANQRQGTSAAKTRSDVAGGGRKPWRQKGTGRARAGTIRSPIWAGGGVAFPPIPHSWRQRLPKKVKTLARHSAINDRAENDRVVIADLPEMQSPKTRDLIAFMRATDGVKKNLYLSSRNLPAVSVIPFGEESVYDVLWAHTIVIERSALEASSSSSISESEEKDADEIDSSNEEGDNA